MIVIYTQDRTYISREGEDAKKTLISVYGNKLGSEAYEAVFRAPYGSTFRKNGGPLVQVVNKEEAEKIREKEKSIDMVN